MLLYYRYYLDIQVQDAYMYVRSMCIYLKGRRSYLSHFVTDLEMFVDCLRQAQLSTATHLAFMPKVKPVSEVSMLFYLNTCVVTQAQWTWEPKGEPEQRGHTSCRA